MKNQKQKKQQPTKPRTDERRPSPPAPSDDSVKLAATLALQRQQLEMFGLQAREGAPMRIVVPSVFANEFRTGARIEQVLVRLLMTGASIRVIAGTLGLPRAEVDVALCDLACGARVDWTPRGKAVA